MKLHFFFVAVALSLVAMTPASSGVSSSLSAILTSQEPFPAVPGENVDVEVEIHNNGQGAANEVIVELVASGPFSLLPGEENSKTFGVIAPSSSVKTTYRLHVDESALSGTYDLELKIFLDGITTSHLVKKFSVNVQGDAKIIIEDVRIEPADVEAGGTAEMEILTKNVGTGKARQLTLTLNSTPELIPLFSEGISFLGELKPGENRTSRISLSVDSAAEQKTYVMRLRASYTDESGSSIDKDFDIGVPVRGTVKLDIIKTEADYARGVVEIEVANKGTTEAKSVEARLYKGGELIDIDYISQIKANKKTTFSFPLQSEGQGDLEITFIGPGLKEEVVEKKIVFDFAEPQGNNNFSGAIVVVVIVAVAGYWFYRRRKKK